MGGKPGRHPGYNSTVDTRISTTCVSTVDAYTSTVYNRTQVRWWWLLTGRRWPSVRSFSAIPIGLSARLKHCGLD